MKKIALLSLALALASCSTKPLEKANLEYKVFPKMASFKYDFNVAIPQVVDARNEDFILGNDNYFAKPVAKSLSNILFEEIRSTNAFNTVALLDDSINFNPTSTQIQEIRRSVGKDAIFLAQINKFNANVRKLSDTDTSNFVNLKVFTNITYKLILVDSETVIFLTTKDTSSDKTVPLDENIYKTINELAVANIKNNIIAAKNDFILTTKGTIDGESPMAKQQVKTLKIEKEFNLQEEQARQAELKKAEEAAKAEQAKEEAKVKQVEETPATAEAPAQEEIVTEEVVKLPASEEIKIPAENVTQETANAIVEKSANIEPVEEIKEASEVLKTTPAEVTDVVDTTTEIAQANPITK